MPVRVIKQTTHQRPCISRVTRLEKRGWFYAAVGIVAVATVGITVYEVTIAPPAKVTGGVSVH